MSRLGMLTVLAGVFSIQCGNTASHDPGFQDREITIPHETYVKVPGTQPPLTIGFALKSDSRCPMNAQCVQPGTVVVILRFLERGGSESFRTVVVGDAPPAALRFNGRNGQYSIAILGIEPYPDAKNNPAYPPKNKYSITVRVSRFP